MQPSYGSLSIRLATIDDMTFLFELRNEPAVRRNAFDGKLIEFDEHQRWFSNRLEDDSSLILIAALEGKSIGQFRLDIDSEADAAEVDIAISPQYRGFEFGTQLLRLGCEFGFRNRKLSKIQAHIKLDNKASLASFSKAGFSTSGEMVFKGQSCIEMFVAAP